MKNKIFLIFIFILSVSIFAEYIDIIEMSDGSIIRGVIVEQKPGEHIKIETPNGSIIKIYVDDIKLLTKEKVKSTSVPVEKSPPARRRSSRRSYSDFPPQRDFLDAGFSQSDYNVARSMDLDIANYRVYKTAKPMATTRKRLKSAGIPLFCVGLVLGIVTYYYNIIYTENIWELSSGNDENFRAESEGQKSVR